MTTTQHPERRAGQRWRSEATIGGKPYVVEGTLLRYEDFGQQLGIGWHIAAATVNGKPRDDGGYVFYDKNWHEPNRPMALLADVPAAAPLAADRTGCKAWCGMRPAAIDASGIQWRHDWRTQSEDAKGSTWHCSTACRDARLPPLAAQPAEMKLPWAQGSNDGVTWVYCDADYGKCSHRHHRATHVAPSRPAPQPAPACAYGCSDVTANTACPTHGKPGPAEAVCVIAGGLHGGEVLKRTWKGPITVRTDFVCEGCYLNMENAGKWLHSTGKPYTGPERLDRPKLAHSFGVEDPALEDA